MNSLLVRLKFNINISQGIRLAIQKGQAVSIFTEKIRLFFNQTSS